MMPGALNGVHSNDSRRVLWKDGEHVFTDRVRIQQVVLSLILNPVETMSGVDGPRELLISTEQVQTHGVVTVRDSGPGIDPEKRERVFEAFYTTKSNGVGMGLSICRSIIDAHGAVCGWRRTNLVVRHFNLRFSVR
jgi:signal transduction histidine kinase